MRLIAQLTFSFLAAASVANGVRANEGQESKLSIQGEEESLSEEDAVLNDVAQNFEVGTKTTAEAPALEVIEQPEVKVKARVLTNEDLKITGEEIESEYRMLRTEDDDAKKSQKAMHSKPTAKVSRAEADAAIQRLYSQPSARRNIPMEEIPTTEVESTEPHIPAPLPTHAGSNDLYN